MTRSSGPTGPTTRSSTGTTIPSTTSVAAFTMGATGWRRPFTAFPRPRRSERRRAAGRLRVARRLRRGQAQLRPPRIDLQCRRLRSSRIGLRRRPPRLPHINPQPRPPRLSCLDPQARQPRRRRPLRIDPPPRLRRQRDPSAAAGLGVVAAVAVAGKLTPYCAGFTLTRVNT
jgi:hypothetical protein